MTLLNTALYWHSQGISIVPCYYRSKTPHAQALIRSGLVKSNGKAAWAPLKNSLPTTDQIKAWFLPDTEYNLALITTDRFIVLDFDCPTEYAHWYCWHLEHNPVVLDTYVVTTSQGLHLYYRLDNPLIEPINTSAFTLEALNLISEGKSRRYINRHCKPPKILLPYEIKAHGGRLITIPPSVHPTGASYRAVNSPNNILTVDSIKDVLTFSPVEIKRSVVKKNNGPWEIQPNGNGPMERVDLLDLFPEARQTDTEGHYFITDCPFHGHRNNFMLNVADNVCYCFGGCGTFLATEIAERLNNE